MGLEAAVILAAEIRIGRLIDENVPFSLQTVPAFAPTAPVRVLRCLTPATALGESAAHRDTEIRRVTAGTDPETVRAHVNRINRWQTASEHQYPGPYRPFLHEWCR